jgi:hypothetical protein
MEYTGTKVSPHYKMSETIVLVLEDNGHRLICCAWFKINFH